MYINIRGILCKKMINTERASEPEGEEMEKHRRPLDVDIMNDEEIREQLEQYIKAVEDFPLIQGEELSELLERMRSGDEAARVKLTESRLRLVLPIVDKFRNRGLSVLDLIMAGNSGLIDAMKRYKGNGADLDKYAGCYIRHYILRELSRVDLRPGIPLHQVIATRNVIKAARRFVQKEGREPTDQELAEEIGMPVEEVEEIMRDIRFDSQERSD